MSFGVRPGNSTCVIDLARTAGATPNVIMSASESSSAPNEEAAPVSRATLPSSASQIMPTKIAVAALTHSAPCASDPATVPQASTP